MQKLSKSDQKIIKSLKYKKYRYKYGLFVVEGIKVIKEFLDSKYSLQNLYTLEDEFSEFTSDAIFISEQELKSISFLTTPQVALGVFKIQPVKIENSSGLCLALDNVKDPGNLGTIIRLADWFGIQNIICNTATVDCYNPKVVQASMGSLTRVNILYTDLSEYLKTCNKTIYTSELKGEDVYNTPLDKNALLVMGNESHGIAKHISNLADAKLTIPQFGTQKKTESLNVAMATSIILSEFCRRTIEKKSL